MSACVATRAGKLIDQRFVRSLSDGERGRMDRHLEACGHCRERYRRMQLAERVAAHGADGPLDVPSPLEVERMAESLGLVAPERRGFSLPVLPAFGGFASLAVALIAIFFFMRPPPEYVGARGGAEGPSVSAYAVGEKIRLLESGAVVSAGEHLKLRASGLQGEVPVHVLLVDGQGDVEHVELGTVDASTEIVTIPGAISLSELEPGRMAAYVIFSTDFSLEAVQARAAARAPPEALAEVLEGATVRRVDLVLGGAAE